MCAAAAVHIINFIGGNTMKEKLNKLVGFARKCNKKVRAVAMTAAVSCMMAMSCFASEGDTTVLSGVINADMLNGVLDEIIALLPIVFPVMIAFIGIRKGISFVKSALRSA